MGGGKLQHYKSIGGTTKKGGDQSLKFQLGGGGGGGAGGGEQKGEGTQFLTQIY